MRKTDSPSGGFNLILFQDVHRLGAGLSRTNQVVLVLGADSRTSNVGSVEPLDQISTQDFAAGLRSMGIEENEAFRLAGICCRSVVVFSRLDALGTVTEPAWSKSAELVPLILCGGGTHRTSMTAKLLQPSARRPTTK